MQSTDITINSDYISQIASRYNSEEMKLDLYNKDLRGISTTTLTQHVQFQQIIESLNVSGVISKAISTGAGLLASQASKNSSK